MALALSHDDHETLQRNTMRSVLRDHEFLHQPGGDQQLPRDPRAVSRVDRLGNRRPATTAAAAATEACREAVMTRIDAVYYVSQRRLAPTSVRHFLTDAGFAFDAQIVAPEAFPGAMLGESCLTMIDAEAEVPWAAIARAIAESPRGKFVFCGRSITPDMVHAAMNAGLHGLLSLHMPRMEAGIALANICEGERRFCFQAGGSSRA